MLNHRILCTLLHRNPASQNVTPIEACDLFLKEFSSDAFQVPFPPNNPSTIRQHSHATTSCFFLPSIQSRRPCEHASSLRRRPAGRAVADADLAAVPSAHPLRLLLAYPFIQKYFYATKHCFPPFRDRSGQHCQYQRGQK